MGLQRLGHNLVTKQQQKQIHKVMYVGEKIQNTKSQRACFHEVGKIDPDNSKIGQLFNVCGRSKLCKKRGKWEQVVWAMRIKILVQMLMETLKATAKQRLQYSEGMSQWAMPPSHPLPTVPFPSGFLVHLLRKAGESRKE